MVPTLAIGQRVLVNRHRQPLRRTRRRRHRRLPPAARRGHQRVRQRGQGQFDEARRAACPATRPTPTRVGRRTSSSASSGCPATASPSATATSSATASSREDRYIRAVRRRRRLQLLEHDHRPAGPLLHDGRQPRRVRRQPLLGPRPARLDHRQRLRHVLAAEAHRPAARPVADRRRRSSMPASLQTPIERRTRPARRSATQPPSRASPPGAQAVRVRPRARRALRRRRRRGRPRLPRRAAGRGGGAVRLRAAAACARSARSAR